jgi:membrane-bound metal-dependent hydrolase YbcI (DUF457 family)
LARFETHVLTAPTTFLFVNIFQGYEITTGALAACVGGGIICEIDLATSIVGRTLPIVPFARRFEFSVEHRNFFHSLGFLLLMGIILYPFLGTRHFAVYLAFLLSMLQHQIIDGLTPEPIRWLAPFSRIPFRFSPNPAVTIANGSPKETKLRWTLFLLMLLLAFINFEHPRWLLNTYFADVQAGIEFIHEFGDRHQFTADFSARELISQKKIEGEWAVEGFLDRRIIMRDPTGKLWSIVDSYESNATLRAEHFRIYKKRPIRVETQSVELRGKPLGQLRQYIDTLKHHRLFADKIALHTSVFLSIDPLLFNPVTASGTYLDLAFATLQDLIPLRDAVVEEGKISILYNLEHGEKLDLIPIQEPSWVRLKITLDRLAELRVKEGDTLSSGTIVAVREKLKNKMKLNEQEQLLIRKKIQSLEEINKERLARDASEKIFRQSEIGDAEQDWQAHRKLLETNGVARQAVRDKERRVQSLRTDLETFDFRMEQQALNFQEQRNELDFSLQRLHSELTDLQKQINIRANTQGKIREIVSEQVNGKIHVSLFIEATPERSIP